MHGRKRPTVLTLQQRILAWVSQAEIARFMAHNRAPFLTALQPLLLHENRSNPAPEPYVLQLHPGIPPLELGAVSSLYELSFDPTPNSDVKTGLAIETQLCRSFFQDAAQALGDGDSFLRMDAVWVEPYDPGSGDQTSQAKTIPPRTLFVIICWASQNSETLVLSSPQISESSSGDQTLTTGEYFAKNILHLADRYTKNDVAFENVSAANVAWLDKEEKWSTYVARLLAEEDDRRNKEEGGRES